MLIDKHRAWRILVQVKRVMKFTKLLTKVSYQEHTCPTLLWILLIFPLMILLANWILYVCVHSWNIIFGNWFGYKSRKLVFLKKWFKHPTCVYHVRIGVTIWSQVLSLTFICYVVSIFLGNPHVHKERLATPCVV